MTLAAAERPHARSGAPGATPATGAAPSLLPAGMAGLTGVLCIAGVVMVGSASAVVSIVDYGSSWAIELRECLFMVLGVGAFVGASRLSLVALHRLARLGVLASLALLCLVVVPGLGTSSGGAARWLGLGPLQLQPSELAKLCLCLYAAHVIAQRERVERRWQRVLVPVVLVTGLMAALVFAQPDMGTAIVLVATAFAVAIAAGAPGKMLGTAFLALSGLAVVAGLAMPYRRARLLSFLHPNAYSSGAGYQLREAMIGLGTGHLFGLGLGNSREKWGLLPNPHTDFIFAILGEELGLVGGVVVLGLLVALVLMALRVASRSPDRFSQLLAVGIAAWLGTETIVNVGGVIGVLPITGIPLPFVSFGGTSLVIDMAAVGILVGIARRNAQRPLRVVAAAPAARAGSRQASSARGTAGRSGALRPGPQRRSGLAKRSGTARRPGTAR